MDIRFEGFDEVLNSIDKIGDTSKLSSALEKACAVVERSAKQKAPKDTGNLRRSITSKVENSGGAIRGIVYTPLEYAAYCEYGTGLFAEKGGRKDVPWFYKDDEGEGHITRGQHPTPYMRPALNENRDKIVKIVKETLAK